jgi:hypothetical protein
MSTHLSKYQFVLGTTFTIFAYIYHISFVNTSSENVTKMLPLFQTLVNLASTLQLVPRPVQLATLDPTMKTMEA